MPTGTNTAGTLQHDLNAGRFVVPELPASLQGTDIGLHLTDLSNRLQDAMTQIQRAFRTLGAGRQELTVVTDVALSGNDLQISKTVALVIGSGGASTSTVSGTNC